MPNLTSFIQNEFAAAMNNHDVNRALQCFDDNATMTFSSSPPGWPDSLRGKKEIRQFLEKLSEGFHVEPKNFRESGDHVEWMSHMTSNMLKEVGLDSAETTVKAVVKNNKIISFSPAFTAETMAKLQATRQGTTQQRTGTRPTAG